MKLRIIAGELKGRVVTLAGRLGDLRPTAERQRESVAQIVAGRIDGARVADVCAGTGVFGFEMLSRGAREAHFVEVDRGRARAIEQAAEQLGVAGKVRVWAEDVRRFMGRVPGQYDIVYYDPPYDDDALAQVAPELVRLLTGDGVLLWEHSRRRQLPPGDLARCIDTRTYGMTVVDFLAAVRAPDAGATDGCQKGEGHACRALSGDL